MASIEGAGPHRLEVELDEEDLERLARIRILMSDDEGMVGEDVVVATALEVLAQIAENQVLGGTSYLSRGFWRRDVRLRFEGEEHVETEDTQ